MHQVLRPEAPDLVLKLFDMCDLSFLEGECPAPCACHTNHTYIVAQFRRWREGRDLGQRKDFMGTFEWFKNGYEIILRLKMKMVVVRSLPHSLQPSKKMQTTVPQPIPWTRRAKYPSNGSLNL